MGLYFDVDSSYKANNQSVRCPFHDDNNKSASIHFGKRVFNCFACGEGYSFEKLYTLCFGENDEDSSDDVRTTPTTDSEEYKADDPEFLSSKEEVINQCKEFIEKRGIPKQIYEELGAYPDLDETSDTYGYLVFPNGNGYVGRRFIAADNSSGKGNLPKYKNAKGEKSLYDPFRLVGTGQDLVICEGPFDLCALVFCGFRNVVATLGCETSEKVAYELKDHTCFILFDRDYAGYKGAREFAKHITDIGGRCITIEMPRRFGKDSAEAIQIDKDEFTTVLSQKLTSYDSFSEYEVSSFIKNTVPLRQVKTVLNTLDDALSGGYTEGCHGIVGPPKIGKSAFVMSLVKQWILKNNMKGLVCSYELPIRQYMARLAAMVEGKPWPEIDKNPSILSQSTKDILINKIAPNLKVTAGWNIHEITRASKNFDFIVVDYIQRMPSLGSDERLSIKQNISLLSDLARDKHKIILVVSSIPRDKYTSDDVGIFKESGDIEYVIQSGLSLRKLGNTISDPRNSGYLVGNLILNTRGETCRFWLKSNMSTGEFTEASPDDLLEV